MIRLEQRSVETTTFGSMFGIAIIRLGAIVLYFSIIWVVLFCIAARSSAAMFNAQVVDAETGEPLEGAAAVIVWFRQTYIPLCMDSCSVFYRAREVVTNVKGKFAVDTSAGFQSFAFHHRNVAIFKPGYKPVTGITLNHTDVLFEPAALKLIKIRSREEARKYMSDYSIGIDTCHEGRSGWCVPPKEVPRRV